MSNIGSTHNRWVRGGPTVGANRIHARTYGADRSLIGRQRVGRLLAFCVPYPSVCLIE